MSEIKLADGRALGYAQYGKPNGKPVFFFHGTPSSRLLRHPDDNLTASLGVRLITIDRPGYGKSDDQPKRQLLDWPEDVLALADSLGIERFAVMGVSGGGPYVAACAFKIPHRLTKVGIVAGVGPTEAPELLASMYKERRIALRLARLAPWLLKPLIWLTNNPQRDIDRYYQKIITKSSQADQEVLSLPEIKSLLKASWLESTRNGVSGFTRDGIIFSHPWGFRLDEIQTKVYLWHGDEDTSIPKSMAESVASRITNCHLTILQGKGHFILFDIWEDLLITLTN